MILISDPIGDITVQNKEWKYNEQSLGHVDRDF